MGKVSFENLRRKPFLLITSTLAVVGWAVAFGGACMLKVLNGAWWVVVYQLLITLGHIMVFLSGSIPQYKISMMTFLASSIPLLTIQVDYVIQYNRPSVPKLPSTIYVAGYITLLIVQYGWVLVLGSDPNTSLGKLGYTVNESISLDYEAGFYTTEKANESKHQSQYTHAGSAAKILNPINSAVSVNTIAGLQKPSSPVEYTEKVIALHAYKANPSDPKELSFEKGETLEIANKKGNWWQARNSNGVTGIIPSNYFA